MIEEMLCVVGKIPKILSYIDEKENNYVQLTLKLNDNITHNDLKTFFNSIYYRMKLDNGYTNSFSKCHSSSDLINFFKEILKAKDVISLKELYAITNCENTCDWLPIKLAVQQFFSMFEVVMEQTFSLEEYDETVEQENLLFRNQNSNLEKELETIYENTIIMNEVLGGREISEMSQNKVKKLVS